MPRALFVAAPLSLSIVEFEKSLHKAIARSALHEFAQSPAGRQHFQDLGIDPGTVPRYVRYSFGQGERINRANEIYIARPREDSTRLAMIAERLILDHVLRQI